MRSFGAAALVVGLTASQCAAQVDEQASSQLYNQLSRLAAESQKGESLRERKLGHHEKKRHKHHGDEEVTETATTALPDDDRQRHSHTGPHTRQQNESCSVCGEGMEVGNPDGLVVFPGQAGQIPCGILENMGKLGLIPAPQCAVLPQLIGITCECQSSTGPTIPATTTTPGSITTTDATKPGGSKGGKSIGHSMSVPAKAGKSIHGKASSPSTDMSGWSSGGSLKTVISTKAIKASSAKAEKSSSSSGESKGGKASSSSASGRSKGGKGSVHEWSTEDAKAHKVKGETKSSPKAEKTPPAKDPPPPPPPAKKSKTTKDTKAKKASSSGGKSGKGSTGGGAPPAPPAPGTTDDWSGPASSWENNGN